MSQPALDFEPIDDPSSPTYSVGELADAINDQLRRGFSDGVWVRGEIDGLRNAGPHTYFTLVEETERGRAVLNVSLFAPMKRNLTPVLRRSRLDLANGMKVRIFGQLDYYAPNGRLGLKMSGIDPRFTLGELSQARDQVVRRLVASGLYDANRDRPWPRVPLRVGVVTSVGTAAWHDFHDELVGSALGFVLAVCDTRVQGAGADESLAAAIRTLGRRADLDCIAVIRGGGARNDLATFDAEPIAIAIATNPLPVLTGLGHEIDRSVADDVAHRALKTPTACAVALVEAVSSYLGEVESTWAAIGREADQRLLGARASLTDRAHRVARRTHSAVERADERLTIRSDRVRTLPFRRLEDAERRLVDAAASVVRRGPRILDDRERDLDAIAARLTSLDPANLLRRGWSITRDASGRVVRSVSDVATGSTITTQVADGVLTSRIEEP